MVFADGDRNDIGPTTDGCRHNLDGALVGDMLACQCAVDQELVAAIEYKIACDGAAGAERVLDLLNQALRRSLRP